MALLPTLRSSCRALAASGSVGIAQSRALWAPFCLWDAFQFSSSGRQQDQEVNKKGTKGQLSLCISSIRFRSGLLLGASVFLGRLPAAAAHASTTAGAASARPTSRKGTAHPMSVIGISLQTYFSIQHVQAASYFAHRASRMEKRSAGSFDPRLQVAVVGYAASALFTTVAFLEALAAELYADAVKPDGGHLSALDPKALSSIAELAKAGSVEKAPVMSRFDRLLTAAGLQPVSRGCDPGQAVAIAIRLRNELVHYKAEFFDMGTAGMVRAGSFFESSLPQQIRGRFKSRHCSGGAADRWLGAGCAKWAFSSAVAYTDQVFARLGVTPLYDHVRQNFFAMEQ